MRKLWLIVLFVCVSVGFSSCGSTPSSLDAVLDLKYAHRISGRVYSSQSAEGGEYYIDDDMERMLFGTATAPKNYSLILSPNIDYPYELMLIIPEADEDASELSDLARLRLVLLSGDSSAEPAVTGEFIVYSTAELDFDIVKALRKIIP